MVLVGGLGRTKFDDEGAGLRRRATESKLVTGATGLLAALYLLLNDDELMPAESEVIGREGRV